MTSDGFKQEKWLTEKFRKYYQAQKQSFTVTTALLITSSDNFSFTFHSFTGKITKNKLHNAIFAWKFQKIPEHLLLQAIKSLDGSGEY